MICIATPYPRGGLKNFFIIQTEMSLCRIQLKYQVNLSIYVTIQTWLGSKGLSLTLFASLAMVAEAFSMRLQSSASADGGPKAGEVVDHLEDIVLFLMQGTLLASWSILLSFSGWQWAQCLCMLKQRGLCVCEGPHSDQLTKLFISVT